MILHKKASKTSEMEALILKILETKPEVSLREVMQTAGAVREAWGDRKLIQRACHALLERGIIEAKGNARARVYVRRDEKKLASPRGPVGYKQTFLLAYQPNQTVYLSMEQRKELQAVGRSESVVRPAGTYARNIINRLLIELSWNSSRLEGNTYSMLETKRLIELGESAQGKDGTETQMILNHKNAIEYIIESSAEPKITSHIIRSIHGLLSENLLGDPSASGRIRQIAVGISGTTYVPLDNPHLIQEYFDVFIRKVNLIEDPFEKSFFSLVHLSYLQAFEDVNKRTARLVANIPFIQKNLNPLSFVSVEGEPYAKALVDVYERNDISAFRELYIESYHASCQQYSAMQQTLGKPNEFKLKYRSIIVQIIRSIILEKVRGNQVVSKIKSLLALQPLSKEDAAHLFQVIETEILSLHDGNIARFKIRPSEFQAWRARS